MTQALKYYDFRIKDKVEAFTKQLFYALFDPPERRQLELKKLDASFRQLNASVGYPQGDALWSPFCGQLDTIRERLDLDARAILAGDPAANSLDEVYLAYPGFCAIAIHRLSNALLQLGLPLVPRMMSDCRLNWT